MNISRMTAGRYYKARKRFIVQIVQAVGKKTKGILCVSEVCCRFTAVVKLTSSD